MLRKLRSPSASSTSITPAKKRDVASSSSFRYVRSCFLGTYPFQAGTAGFVRNPRGSDNARADAVILFPAAAGGEVQLSGIYPDGPNMVLPAHGLRLDKQYVLTFASSLEEGFNTVVDGPRSPDVDSDPSRDTFSDARPSGMPENGFYRLEELP